MSRKIQILCLLLVGIFTSAGVQAKELTVMISGGFKAAWQKLEPAYAKQEGLTINTVPGPSMGNSPDAIPYRLAAGQKADVVIMVGYALDALDKQGRVLAGSRRELADSKIGAVVQQGQPKLDISNQAALRDVLLNAKSIAYSDSASGRYIEEQLFKKLGIEQQTRGKAHKIEQTPVASTVANGKNAMGFQQVSELLPVPGVTFIGKIPDNLQYVTRFAGAVVKNAEHPQEAKALLEYLASTQVQNTVRATGLDTVADANVKTNASQ